MPAKVERAADALPLWLASIPDPFTPTEGEAAARAALDDAAAVVLNVKGKFQGTLPPPPWPRSPALDKAIDDVEVTRDAMQALADHSKGIALSWPKTSGKVGPTLVRVGSALYAQLADLEGKAKGADTVAELLKLVPSPTSFLKDVPALLLLGVGLLALVGGAKISRTVKGAIA
jgi:hypothetical protein